MPTGFSQAMQFYDELPLRQQVVKQGDERVKEALGWLALQSQIEQRKQQQAEQQKKAAAQAFAMMPGLSAPPTPPQGQAPPMTPPNAMAPGAPSQPMQPPPSGPPMGAPGGMSVAPGAAPPQPQTPPWRPSMAAGPQLGGQGAPPLPGQPQTPAPNADILPPNLMTAQQAIDLIQKNPNIPEEMRYPTLQAMLPIMDEQNRLAIAKWHATTEAKKAATAEAKRVFDEKMKESQLNLKEYEAGSRDEARRMRAAGGGAGGALGATFNQEYDKLNPRQQATVDFYATQQIGGDSTWRVGLGRTAGGSALIKAVEERVPEVATELGLSAADVGTNRAKRVANQAALTQITKDITTIKPFAAMLDQNADILKGLAKKIIKTQSPLANRPLNWLQNNAAGDPDVAEFLAQMKLVQVEAARVIQNPRLVGQLTDEAQRELAQIVNGEMSLSATDRVLDRIINDSQRRVGQMEKQRDTLTAGIKEQMTGPGKTDDAGGKKSAPPEAVEYLKKHPELKDQFKAKYGYLP